MVAVRSAVEGIGRSFYLGSGSTGGKCARCCVHSGSGKYYDFERQGEGLLLAHRNPNWGHSQLPLKLLNFKLIGLFFYFL